MSNKPIRYVLDANVFIQAKRRFYPFDVCPGYWESLCYYREQGRVESLDKVADELKRGNDNLWDWARKDFKKEGFVASQAAAEAYGKIVTWVYAENFNPAAKNEFMSTADGWLAAYAMDTGCVVVTLEEVKENAKRVVPLANICLEFGIQMITPFEMLRQLGVKLSWTRPN
jgi:hypothetical protein